MENIVERIVFEIIDKSHGYYVLYSYKYRIEFEGILEFLDIDEPQIGDSIEIPISIITEFCTVNEQARLKIPILRGTEMVLNHYLLTFELPKHGSIIPSNFNVENDYAYLTYKKTNKRILLQRAYG